MRARHPNFYPVIEMPDDAVVYDLSTGQTEDRTVTHPWGIGKYDEKRPGIYVTPLFGGVRDVHMGIDLFAPVGTELRSFADARVLCFGYNAAAGDYGYTLVIETAVGTVPLYALYGHLNRASVEGKREGQRLVSGEVIAWVGDRHENGGYPPHLHFQLSYERPDRPDLPGAVSEADRAAARLKYPDPRLVLGAIY